MQNSFPFDFNLCNPCLQARVLVRGQAGVATVTTTCIFIFYHCYNNMLSMLYPI